MFSRLVDSVSSALDLNIATLSGCIDIIVVPQENGTLRCTPFHVRFGKTKLLRSREKIVNITVNGVATDLTMKLGAAGEAYFETQDAEDGEMDVEKMTKKTAAMVVTTGAVSSASGSFLEGQGGPNAALSQQPPTAENESSSATPPSPSRGLRTSFPLEGATSSVEFALCGHLLSGLRSDAEKDNATFSDNILTWSALNANPLLWHHVSLVCRFDRQAPFYPGKVALPLIASWVAFDRPLSLQAVRTLMETPYSGIAYRESEKGLMQQFHGVSPTEASSSGAAVAEAGPAKAAGPNEGAQQSGHFAGEEDQQAPLLATHAEGIDCHQSAASAGLPPQLASPLNAACVQCTLLGVRRVLRPTSEQLESLRLRPGANPITFSVSSMFQGAKSVSGTIYLWPRNSKIIVSDVDGTITRSDVLGQLMPIVGRDWSHEGVAQLFSKCRDNNYKLLYLTARAIGQADATRDYLFGLRQGLSSSLPDGPLIMSPDRLFPSFKREVIDRKPYIFKIAALRDIRNLFPRDYNPFYAGFGNRDTDHRSYVHIGIPESRVFIIDTKGTIHHINATYAKTYESLGEITDYMFPPVPRASMEGRLTPMVGAASLNHDDQVRRAKRLDSQLVYGPAVGPPAGARVRVAGGEYGIFGCCRAADPATRAWGLGSTEVVVDTFEGDTAPSADRSVAISDVRRGQAGVAQMARGRQKVGHPAKEAQSGVRILYQHEYHQPALAPNFDGEDSTPRAASEGALSV